MGEMITIRRTLLREGHWSEPGDGQAHRRNGRHERGEDTARRADAPARIRAAWYEDRKDGKTRE